MTVVDTPVSAGVGANAGTAFAAFVSRVGGVVTLHLTGDLDAVSGPVLTQGVDLLCAATGEPVFLPVGGTVLIDMTALTSLDSAGTSALVRVLAAFNRRHWFHRLVLSARRRSGFEVVAAAHRGTT